MAFLQDTNVLSETRLLSLGRGSLTVKDWLERYDAEMFFLSAMTIFETEIGIRRLERRDPRQAAVLRGWMDTAVLPTFHARILPVDDQIATLAASFHVPDPRPLVDSLIAATAIVHGLTIVTRNTADFLGLPVSVLNPWEM